MESAFDVFLYLMAAVGFAVGVGLFFLLLGFGVRTLWRWICPPRPAALRPNAEIDETVPYNERQNRRMAHRYIGLDRHDPRSPEFVAWAVHEYDEMFGEPRNADQLHEKNRTILGWAFIALNWFVHPPTGQPQLTPVEAAWFYRQLESSFWRVPGTRHEEPAD